MPFLKKIGELRPSLSSPIFFLRYFDIFVIIDISVIIDIP